MHAEDQLMSEKVFERLLRCEFIAIYKRFEEGK